MNGNIEEHLASRAWFRANWAWVASSDSIFITVDYMTILADLKISGKKAKMPILYIDDVNLIFAHFQIL